MIPCAIAAPTVSIATSTGEGVRDGTKLWWNAPPAAIRDATTIAIVAHRADHPHSSARTARNASAPRMAYSVRWASFRITKCSGSNVSGGSGWPMIAAMIVWITDPVCCAAKESVEATKIMAHPREQRKPVAEEKARHEAPISKTKTLSAILPSLQVLGEFWWELNGIYVPAGRRGRSGAAPLRVLDGLDLPGRHVVDPAVDVQLLLLGGLLDEGKLAEVLELEPNVLLHDQPHPLLLRHPDAERPDLLVDPLARLEGVHQPDRNVLVLALVVVERLDPPATIVTAYDDVRDLQVADGELQDGGQVPVVRRDDISDVSVDEDLPRARRRDAVDGRAGVGAADPENRRLLSL